MIEKMLRTTILCVSVLLSVTTAKASDKKEACQLVKIADLPVMITPSNAMLANGSIKGEPVRFLIDTGSIHMLLDKAVISHFGLSTGSSYSIQNSFNGPVEAARSVTGQLPELKIGTFKFEGNSFSVSDEHHFEDPIYGKFGLDFLQSFDLEFDLQKNNIGLFQHNPCPTEPIYWADNFSEASLAPQQNGLLVQVDVNGASTMARFDTSMPRSIVTLSFARHLGIDAGSPGAVRASEIRGRDGHPIPSFRYRFVELKVGDEVVKNPVLLVADQSRSKFDSNSMYRIQDTKNTDEGMILGVDFIRQHHIYLATKEQKMYFTWNGGSMFALPTDDAAASASTK